MKKIEAKKVLFIKLGEGSKYAQDCIKKDHNLRLSYREVDHNLCVNQNWDEIHQYFMAKKKTNTTTASNHLKQIKHFYEEDENTLWITFEENKLWWCFSKLEITLLDDKTKTRPVIGEWSDEDINGNPLLFSNISDELLKTKKFRGTICKVTEFDYTLKLINCELSNEKTEVENEIQNMNENETKLKLLKDLGSLRKKSCYQEYFSISDFHDGKYESEFVSPYTNSAQNANSQIVILLQDWSSEERLKGEFREESAKLGYTPKLPTNRNLKRLLFETFNRQLYEVFVTNVFPFIKKGSISSHIPQKDYNKAFSEFCYPQIEIVSPKLVICCGQQVFITVLNHFKKPINNLDPVGNHFESNGFLFYHQRHTGSNGINRNGGILKAIDDWKKMKTVLNLNL
jgi:hypothetical protein